MATLILKATESCNSNCYYCDVVRKKDTGATMSLEVLETVFRRVGDFLRQRPGERVEIIWHGGEPLLPGPAFYEAALAFQERHCGAAAGRITHSIQSNLTCFREEFVPLFRRLGIGSVGTSYDPEPHMRGPGESIDSDTYNRRFLAGVALLERHGFSWGLIYVVTRKSLARPREIFTFLTNLALSGSVSFNPVLIYDEERRGIAVTPAEFTAFLGEIFPFWWEHRSRYPRVQPFQSLAETLIEGKNKLFCADSGGCVYHHVNVSPDGATSQCGRSADWGLLSYGSIGERPLADILADSQRNVLAERLTVLREGECRGCRFWEICHGGCPLDAWSGHRSFLYKSEWCETKRSFIEKHFEPVTGTMYVARTS